MDKDLLFVIALIWGNLTMVAIIIILANKKLGDKERLKPLIGCIISFSLCIVSYLTLGCSFHAFAKEDTEAEKTPLPIVQTTNDKVFYEEDGKIESFSITGNRATVKTGSNEPVLYKTEKSWLFLKDDILVYYMPTSNQN